MTVDDAHCPTAHDAAPGPTALVVGASGEQVHEVRDLLASLGVSPTGLDGAPDLVVVVPGGRLDLLESLAGSVRIHPSARHLVLSPDAPDDAAVLAAVRAGTDGWLCFDLSPTALGAAVQGLLRGEAALPRTVVGALLDQVRLRPRRSVRRDDGRLVELSEREWQVLDLIAHGAGTAVVAARLGVGEATVRGYVRSAALRMRAADRTEAVRLFLGAPRAELLEALAEGLLEPRPAPLPPLAAAAPAPRRPATV